MISRLGNWLFPAVLAAVLGGVSFWLDRAGNAAWDETPPDPSQPQYEITGIRAKQFDGKGTAVQTLTAERAWQFPNRSDAFLANAEIVFSPDGEERYRAGAEQVHYRHGSNEILLSGNVVFNKPAADGTPAAHIETDTLAIDTEAQTARTDAPVRYRYGDSHGTAEGLLYRRADGYLNLPSRLKAVIYDPRNRR